MTKIGNMF